MAERDVVVLSGRSVCSLLGTAKSGASVVGKDGGHSLVAGDGVYWTFGDTVLAGGGLIPNSVGWSADMDASDCINLQLKEEDGVAVPLLGRIPGELTVWPISMELDSAKNGVLLYASVWPNDVTGWEVRGTGIATFDLETLKAERALDGMLVWESPGPMLGRMYADEEYIYFLLDTQRSDNVTETILARVSKDAVLSLTTYEYWNPDSADWIGGLWDEDTASWSSALQDISPTLSQVGLHNGVEVAYNDFLGLWLGVYATNFTDPNFATTINIRAAPSLTGPWEEEETVLVDCQRYHGLPSTPYLCYTGVQHEVYSQHGGRTIYVSYSSGAEYQVYLHEIRLAAPVNEWTGGHGEAFYVPATADAPAASILTGLGFYASDIPVPGFTAIHRYSNDATGQNRYGAMPPTDGDFQDLGVAFYAPTDADAAVATNELYSPVFRWTLGGEERYSPMNLLDAGYERHEVAFYSPCPSDDSDLEASCLESIHGDEPFGSGRQMIVIGDSIAAGYGVEPDQGWAAIVAGRAESDLENLAIPGASSTSVIESVLDWPSGRTQSQLQEARALLTEAAPGSVAAVALGIGVNDWLLLRDPTTGKYCSWNPAPACDALFENAIDLLDDNLHVILTELRAVIEPSTALLVMTYYDIANHQAIETINGVIMEEIAEHAATLVDAQAFFAGREHELVADTVHPSIAGHAVLADIFSNALPPDTDGDGLSEVMEAVLGTDPAVEDTDGDGCSDGQEFGPEETLGGWRDPHNPYDFYDVAGRGGGPPDGVVDLSNDIFGVIQHYAPGGTEPTYDVNFDRGPSPGPNPWNMTAPDGVIDFTNDVLGVLYQYQHACQ